MSLRLFFFSWISTFAVAILLLVSYIKKVISIKFATPTENKVLSGDLTTNIIENDGFSATRQAFQNTVNNFENVVSYQKYAAKEFSGITKNSVSGMEEAKKQPPNIARAARYLPKTISARVIGAVIIS